MSLTIYAYIRFRKLRYWYVVPDLNNALLVTYILFFLFGMIQGIHPGMVDLVGSYGSIHGLHLGFQG